MQTADELTLARALVDKLSRSLRAQVVETHISWVLLGADTAWKIKKPVRLAFVDYSTPAARRRFCEEELRLNRRLAPSLYLGLTRITGSRRAPTLDGPGAALEHAVRMRRFADGALFGEQLAAGTLAAGDVDALAVLLAAFQQQSPPTAAASGFGLPGRRRAAALQALQGAGAVASKEESQTLREWLEAGAQALAPLWAARREAGAIREGHGDLHLDNVVKLDTGVEAFDCIEFEPALRWIDVIDDLAFAVMDFSARGRDDFAFRLLNLWLDLSGDHGALPALRFAVVYRALVRSQVEHLRHPCEPRAARAYLATALEWTRRARPRLFITHGLPGSGKTFASQQLLQREGAIRLRSDVERKRLSGLGMLEDSAARGLDLYDAGTTSRTYQRLLALARAILQVGYPVVLDAAFLRRDERQQAHALAQELRVPFAIVDCDAPREVLRERLLARRGDASEAGGEVLARLRETAQALTAAERELVVARRAD